MSENKRSTMTAFYVGTPGDETDRRVHDIMLKYAGRHRVTNEKLSTGERNVQYSIPRAVIKSARDELKAAGIRTVTR